MKLRVLTWRFALEMARIIKGPLILVFALLLATLPNGID